MCQPRRKENSGSFDSRASSRTRSVGTSPPVFRGVDCPAADVIHADVLTEQVVEMYIYLSKCVGSYVYSFVVDRVPPNDRASNGGDAEDVNPGRTGGRRVRGVRAVAGNTVTNDGVVVEILARRMAVHGNARQAIIFQLIVNYHVAVGLCAGYGIEMPTPAPAPGT